MKEAEKKEVISVEEEVTEEKLKKKFIQKADLVKAGKSAALSLIFKNVLPILLSVILSIVGMNFWEKTFEDDFEEYYNKSFTPMLSECEEIFQYAMQVNDMTSSELVEVYESENLYEKSRDLLIRAKSFSSNNKEINRLHERLVEICESSCDLASQAYSYAIVEENKSGLSGGNLASMSDFHTDVKNFEAAQKNKEKNDGAFLASMNELRMNVEVFEAMQNELCDKHGIKVNEFGKIQKK